MVQKSERMFKKVNITPLGLQILTFLARNLDKQFYIRELARNMDKSVGGIHKTLKSLKKAINRVFGYDHYKVKSKKVEK